MYDVITVGSSTIDAFASVESELIKIKTVHHEEELIAYPSGSKILINDLKFFVGGGGTNTAVALSRLGFRVGYIGKIGSGSNSSLIIRSLKTEKVDFLGAKSKKHHSGYSVILDSLDGDRTILAYKGANNELDFSEIKKGKLKAKWFYFSSMIGKSYETMVKLAELASKNDIKIAFNPSNYLAEKGYAYLKEVLSRTELLILNKEEATLLAGNVDIAEMIRKLSSFGPRTIVITDGKNGAYTGYKKRVLQARTSGIKPKETTGAGDAFASTFLAGTIMKKDVQQCMMMAITNAESVISNTGAKTGLLKLSELKKKLRIRKPKVAYA
jgi:ribokinase